jgi:pimeloyl-ACP methyl ester carboxylesterase
MTTRHTVAPDRLGPLASAALSRRAVLRHLGVGSLAAGFAAGGVGQALAQDGATPAPDSETTPRATPATIQPTHRTVRANGIDVHVAEAGEGSLVLLVHGYPELWYSWRHQLSALAEAGYHAVAPDQVGIGGTEAPAAVERYSVLNLVDDAVGVLDALEAETAVVVGHDWGAEVAWRCAQLRPERVSAIAALSVPFYPRAAEPPTEIAPGVEGFFEDYFGGLGGDRPEDVAAVRLALARLLYALSGDAPPEVLEAVFAGQAGANAEAFRAVQVPDPLPAWLSGADLDYYAQEFARTGFEGVINRYRNLVRDWEELAGTEGIGVEQPALFVGGERDSAVLYSSLEPMRAAVPNLRQTVILPGCGHWVQQERPAEVNAALLDFLRTEV